MNKLNAEVESADISASTNRITAGSWRSLKSVGHRVYENVILNRGDLSKQKDKFSGMNIQQIQMDNLPSVMKIFKKVKKDLKKQNNDQWKWIYPNRSNYKADIKNGTMHGIVNGNELIAVITLDDKQSQQYQNIKWIDQEGKPCCIHRLAVDPDHQGKGLGKFLLNFTENFAIQKGYTSIRIDVYKINETAKGLYIQNGYKEIGEASYPLRKYSYITMEKQI